MSNILYTAYREHVMLLYETDDQRNDSAVAYINEGLKAGHLCLYASVGAYDTASRWHYDKLSSRIVDFEKNVTEGNLVIIDFRPFFESARKGDRTLFDQTRLHVETLLKKADRAGKTGQNIDLRGCCLHAIGA